MRRILAVPAALLLALAPLSAQVRPVVMGALPVAAPAAMSAAGSVRAASMAAAPAAVLPASLPAPSASLSAAPVAAAAAVAAPAAVAAAAAPTAAKPADLAVRTLARESAQPAALAAMESGRRVFDGAALAHGSPAVPATPGVGASARVPGAARGDTVSFNGQSLPARMYSDQTQISAHLIRAIDATQKTLDIAIFELAIREVRDALVRAKDRGVKVRIVMDQGHIFPEKEGAHRTDEVQSLIDAGFELKMLRGADAFGIMHNKFAVFDGALLETGSYNWTRAADTQHYENALFLTDASRIKSFQGYWDWMWKNAAAVDLAHPPAPVQLDAQRHTPPLSPAPQDAAKPIEFNGTSFPEQAFSPHGPAALIAAAIDAARENVVLANFSFTNAEVIEALKRAKDRGVDVRLVFDVGQYRFLKEPAQMLELGFNVRVSAGKKKDGRGVMHNKFGVFDGRLVETGSYNWTMNGELNNYENSVYLDASADVSGYAAYFERIWKQARVPTPDDHPERAAPHDVHAEHQF